MARGKWSADIGGCMAAVSSFSQGAAGSLSKLQAAEEVPVSGVVVREVCEGELLPKEAAMTLASSGVGADVRVTLQSSFTSYFVQAGDFNKAAFAIRVTDANDMAGVTPATPRTFS